MDLKKLAGQAGQLFTRAVQYTEERLGNVEKTELDGYFESLASQADATKLWTEKLVAGAESVIIPNPGNRVEDLLYDKIEKRRPNRLSNLEYLGLDMCQAGNEFGPGTAYGAALLKVGGAEQRLGLTEKKFVADSVQGFVQPLRKFLDTEIRTICRERRLLETKRLDLDASKSRLRKARSMEGQATLQAEQEVMEAEAELKRAQSDFDRQAEITKLLLEGVRSSQASHLRHLNDLMEAQCEYYLECHQIMVDLQKEMAGLSSSNREHVSSSQVDGSSPPLAPSDQPLLPNSPPTDNCMNWRKAKVVCAYQSTSELELSVAMNQAIEYQDNEDINVYNRCIEYNRDDFVYARTCDKGNLGLVPRAYLEPLDD